ncbi:MAG TPA: universal stress protein [Streptosporangiaceae bacterium]
MTVLVAVQDQAESGAALRAAAQEAGFRQARLVALTAYSGEGAVAAPAAQVELRVVQSVPGRSLVDAARMLDAELLLVGSHGEHAMSWLLGSQYVLRNAPCPVLLVPRAAEAPLFHAR